MQPQKVGRDPPEGAAEDFRVEPDTLGVPFRGHGEEKWCRELPQSMPCSSHTRSACCHRCEDLKGSIRVFCRVRPLSKKDRFTI